MSAGANMFDALANLRVERPLAQGGFSRVFVAEHELLGRKVALKILDVSVSEMHLRDAFSRECAAAGRLGSHPNIVTVYDAGFLRGEQPYLVMELADGGNLQDRLRASGVMPLAEAVAIAADVAGALAYTHAAGIVHGDVKPANILFDAYGTPLLSDFGVATFLADAASESDLVAFSMPWASPEVLEGNRATSAHDVFGLGVTLYQMVMGRLPFDAPGADDLPQTLALAGLWRANQLRLHDEPFGERLGNLLELIFDPDPSRRPTSAELSKDLESFLSDRAPELKRRARMTSESTSSQGFLFQTVDQDTAVRDVARLLQIPPDAGPHTIQRGAIRVERQREDRSESARRTVIGTSTFLVSLISAFVAILQTTSDRSSGHDGTQHYTAVGVIIAFVAGIAVVGALGLAQLYRRYKAGRADSLRNRTLEASARVRNAYVRSLRLSAAAPKSHSLPLRRT